MKIVNEALSDLKVYARKTYGINYNIPVLTMLLTEEDHKRLCEEYNLHVEKTEKDGKPTINLSKKEDFFHTSEEFFPSQACMFPLVQRHLATTMPIVTTIIKNAWTISHFSRYKYVIMIREEKLLEYAQRCFPTNLNSASGEMTDKSRKTFALMWLLTHEFLHVIERELNKKIHTLDAETDSQIILDVMKQIKFHSLKKFEE